MKLLENMLWAVGVMLLALFAGAQTWGEVERQHDVAAFYEARLANATPVSSRVQPATQPIARITPAIEPSAVQLRNDAVLAVLRIPEIELEVPVNYGTEEEVLLRGAGLVEGSAPPGSNGNVAIAAHRDTHFRALKDLRLGDWIELATPERTRMYVVASLAVVEPTDLYVLADTGEPVLTLVTCYPFYFVGAAPQRFIVRAVAAERPI